MLLLDESFDAKLLFDRKELTLNKHKQRLTLLAEYNEIKRKQYKD